MLNKLKNGTDSFKELFAIYLATALLVSVLFALFEQRGLMDGLWWAFVTGLTIGYGDIYPVTAAGQVLTVIWSHFMVLVVLPLFVGRVLIVMMNDRNQFTHEEQEEILRYVRDNQRKEQKR